MRPVHLTYFSAAQTMYSIFVALGIGLVLLNWVWQLFRSFDTGIGLEAEDPDKRSLRSTLFIFLIIFSDDILDLVLQIGGTPYQWIMTSELPPINFNMVNALISVILTACSSGIVVLASLIIVIVLAWNYVKLLFECGERYVLLGVLTYTAPIAFAMGASQSLGGVFRSWCRMLGGQIILLLMNAWCLKIFTSLVGNFVVNPRPQCRPYRRQHADGIHVGYEKSGQHPKQRRLRRPRRTARIPQSMTLLPTRFYTTAACSSPCTACQKAKLLLSN